MNLPGVASPLKLNSSVSGIGLEVGGAPPNGIPAPGANGVDGNPLPLIVNGLIVALPPPAGVIVSVPGAGVKRGLPMNVRLLPVTGGGGAGKKPLNAVVPPDTGESGVVVIDTAPLPSTPGSVTWKVPVPEAPNLNV